jgi:hypothetical protein
MTATANEWMQSTGNELYAIIETASRGQVGFRLKCDVLS